MWFNKAGDSDLAHSDANVISCESVNSVTIHEHRR